MSVPAAAALLAALLFGASAPLAKTLAVSIPAVYLAGLLYAGSGIGLTTLRLVRDRHWRMPSMASRDGLRFLAASTCGGMLAPVLLMYGLRHASATHASLLLNLEAVFTAGIAWFVFGENAGSRVVTGMVLIVLGGICLAWSPEVSAHMSSEGVLAVASACALWALDNNLMRDIAGNDALFLAAGKGVIAGVTNLGLATLLGLPAPSTSDCATAMTLGFFGYGISLVLFILALRGLGAARTGAYFSTAPFIGAALSVTLLYESVTWSLWVAGLCMAAGVWLHLTEVHAHQHTHLPMDHDHWHRHDIHHQHEHPNVWPLGVPHAHPHHHVPLTHSHVHTPDLHHHHSH